MNITTEEIKSVLQIIEKACLEYQLPYITIFQDQSGTAYATNTKENIEGYELFSFGVGFAGFYENFRGFLAK